MSPSLLSVGSLLRQRQDVELAPLEPGVPLVDRRLRPLEDLRLSVTDQCNFRCPYCKPRGGSAAREAGANRSPSLGIDDLMAIASAFVSAGVTKIRLTGGEPLLRKDLPRIVKQVASLGVRELCLTTNGSLLEARAQELADAGLRRVTVSLDALDEVTFRRMTDAKSSLGQVMRGIDAARHAGLGPVKLNMVVQRGVNEHAIVPMAAWARDRRLELRFIEYMDVGRTNGWRPEDVVTAEELHARLDREWPLEPVEGARGASPAERFRYRDGAGLVAIIASISRPFCGTCTRARVSSYGVFYPCLFASSGVDLVPYLGDELGLRSLIGHLWRGRDDHYSELRAQSASQAPRPEMSEIGG